MHPSLALRNLNGVKQRVVRELLAGDEVSQTELVKRVGGASQATISRAIAGLITMGIVKKTGSTRNAKFSLTDDARWWALSPALRPKVSFDISRIETYEPNASRWLPSTIADEMKAMVRPSHHLDASTYSKAIAERFLIDLSWASSNLEGNTYDMLDTEVLLRYGAVAEGRSVEEATMILNHKSAINYILERFEKTIDLNYVQFVHALLTRDLVEYPGRIREHEVLITSSCYQPSSSRAELSYALSTLLWKVELIEDPFEASFVALAGLSYIQGFADGNKRLGRLIANVPLLRQGLPPLSFLEIDRRAYVGGLIAFYKLADADLLGRSIRDSYRITAPHYLAVTSFRRVPHRVELAERGRIEKLAHEFLQSGGVLDAFVDASFVDLLDSDAQIARAALRRLINDLSGLQRD